MPDGLKAAMEQRSGLDLSGVRVRYNSPEPARLDALAYTQGRQVHLAPGQERQLPHEVWHVVQQLQGRVRATRHEGGVLLNDNARLEQEADHLGAATSPELRPPPQAASAAAPSQAHQPSQPAPIQLAAAAVDERLRTYYRKNKKLSEDLLEVFRAWELRQKEADAPKKAYLRRFAWQAIKKENIEALNNAEDISLRVKRDLIYHWNIDQRDEDKITLKVPERPPAPVVPGGEEKQPWPTDFDIAKLSSPSSILKNWKGPTKTLLSVTTGREEVVPVAASVKDVARIVRAYAFHNTPMGDFR
jgi:hypothetical protein